MWMGMNHPNHHSSNSNSSSRKSSKITIDAEVVAVEEAVGLQKRNAEDVIEDAIVIEVAVEEETITKTITEEAGMVVEIIQQQQQSSRRMAMLIQITRLIVVNLEQSEQKREIKKGYLVGKHTED